MILSAAVEARVKLLRAPLIALHDHLTGLDPALSLHLVPHQGVPVVDAYGVLGEGETGERVEGAGLGPHLWVDPEGETMFALLLMEIVLTGRIVLTATVYGVWGREIKPITRDYVEILLLDDGRWVWVGPRNKTGPKKWPTYDLLPGITAARENLRVRNETWAKMCETDTAPWVGVDEDP